MPKLYRYVGPKDIADRSLGKCAGALIDSPEDVRRWLRETDQQPDAARSVIATYVIDEDGRLRVAHRRSEHVACAAGKRVRSAGEMTFTFDGSHVDVSWITNQSTGYCPEPSSWPAVEAALRRAGISGPHHRFSQAFDFRRCPRCASINVIKDGIFECAVCDAPLPTNWNLDAETTG